MRTQSPDTPPDIERLQIKGLRQRGAAWRYAWMRSLSRTTIELSRRAIRRTRPHAQDQEIYRFYLELNYGPQFAAWARNATLPRAMLPPDISAALTPLIDALEDLGAAYYIGGSVASSVHGIPRSTLDADLVVHLRPGQIRTFVDLVQATYYVDEQMVRDAVERHSSFQLLHMETFFKIDLFVLKPNPYAQEAFRRRVQDTVSEDESVRAFFLASPEDIVLSKLDWYRMGGGVSERQWNDVLGVLKVQAGALDLHYLRHWAGQLGLSELLDRAFQDAGLQA
jgi:hypothetical protein